PYVGKRKIDAAARVERGVRECWGRRAEVTRDHVKTMLDEVLRVREERRLRWTTTTTTTTTTMTATATTTMT
ncbi:hypothetical protein JZU48_00415, partial [bacterium]|nr:hypothetical protein [bacterium]